MHRRILDLSVPCSNRTAGVRVRLQNRLPVYLGHACQAYDLAIRSHTGTYFETSAHVFRGGMTTDRFPLDKLVLPGVCLQVKSSRRCIQAAELEKAAAALAWPEECALLIRVEKTGPRNFNYFSREAAQWMRRRGVALMGSNTPRYDSGFDHPTGFFIDLFKAEIPIIANLTNLNRLPPAGFTLIVLPLNIRGVCTVPCRVVATVQ